jgi:hypothetical protein
MPNSYFQKISDERNISIRALEEIWEKAKNLATDKFDEGDKGYYAYTTSIFKNMLGLSTREEFRSISSSIDDKKLIAEFIKEKEQCSTDHK